VENIERYLRLGYQQGEAAMAQPNRSGLLYWVATATLVFAFFTIIIPA